MAACFLDFRPPWRERSAASQPPKNKAPQRLKACVRVKPPWTALRSMRAMCGFPPAARPAGQPELRSPTTAFKPHSPRVLARLLAGRASRRTWWVSGCPVRWTACPRSKRGGLATGPGPSEVVIAPPGRGLGREVLCAGCSPQPKIFRGTRRMRNTLPRQARLLSSHTTHYTH